MLQKPKESFFISSGTTRLRAVRWGGRSPKGSQQVMALHGFTGDADDFAPFAEHAYDDTSWHALDLVGHGMSDAPEDVVYYTPDAHIRHLESAEQALQLKDYVLIGYSMGGRAALHYALERPDNIKALVLIGATPGLCDPDERKQRRKSDAALAEHLQHTNLEAFLDEWQETPIISTQKNIRPELRDAMLQRRKRNRHLGLANSLRGFGTGSMPILWGRLSELNIPVLLVTGSDDPKFSSIAHRMDLLMRTAQHVHLLDAGHCAHLEQYEKFNELLDSFFLHYVRY